MTHRSTPSFVIGGDTEAELARIVAGLSDSMRVYLRFGPYPHWTRTKNALWRRKLVFANGALKPLGLSLRDYLQSHPK